MGLDPPPLSLPFVLMRTRSVCLLGGLHDGGGGGGDAIPPWPNTTRRWMRRKWREKCIHGKGVRFPRHTVHMQGDRMDLIELDDEMDVGYQ